ncbi:MAG: Gmad2 immunoglobulin-like domain-containing protein [Anaerolineales bacterium]|nr:MAG: Gmad2 immunoglobulin-like domain-containing protein [Anaerolineales bacterium]
MVPNHPLKLLWALTLATLACGVAFPASDPPTPAPVEATVPAPQGLTLEQIKNVQYPLLIPEDGRVVEMLDGKFQRGADATDMDFAYIALTQFVAFGDLTGDGLEDAAVIFLENYGGTGNFGVLAVYANVAGEPVFLHSTLIDDRPMINSIAVENDEVFIDAVVHGFEDGGCCPTLPTTRRYALVKNKLRLVNFTTDAPNGTRRIIEITSPANGTEATGSLAVIGSVSIAPFENNLSWFIYDENGNQYAAGPVMVAAPDFGAPGTFDETIPLAGIPAGTIIYLEIQDQSAADGSLLALDVVKLSVK